MGLARFDARALFAGLLLASLPLRLHALHLLSAADLRMRLTFRTRAGLLVHERGSALIADVTVTGLAWHLPSASCASFGQQLTLPQIRPAGYSWFPKAA
jgi:hypothetical protein